VKSSTSALDEHNNDLFVCATLDELQTTCKRSTPCVEHVQILTQSPFTTIKRTMKEILKLPCEKELSIEERKGYSRRVI